MGRDRISKEKRSRIMSSIRSKDTKVEWILRSALWKAGLRYRKHYAIQGKPDIVFPRQKLAIFIDGDFWHGHNWRKLRPKLKNNYWINKIKRNRARDRKVNKELAKQGWKIMRIWEHELRKDIDSSVDGIMNSIGG